MLNKTIENKIFKWEMEGISQINILLDAFNYAVKNKRYFLNGYLAVDQQLQAHKEIKEDKFFINYVKKDLKKKGIDVRNFHDEKKFRQATQGIFFHYFCNVYDEIVLLLESCRDIRFFVLTESEIDVLDEKLNTLSELETTYIVHADILLDGESYSSLLFLEKYDADEKTLRGQIEKIIFESLRSESVLTVSQESLPEHNLKDYLDFNQKKLRLDAKVNFGKIQLYTERYESLLNELEGVIEHSDGIEFFDFKPILATLRSETLADIDKIKILSLMVKDIERNLQHNLDNVKSITHLYRAYKSLMVLIVQAKLVVAINKLCHDYYCGQLTQLIKLELLKASIIHHFLNK